MRHMAALALGAIQERPSIAAGVCTFAMAFSLVAGNALYSQPGGHPVPLWATRDKITTRSVTPETPVRGEASSSNLESGFNALSLDRVPVPMMRPQSTPAPASASSLLTQVQSGLARLGFYDGEIDGLFGPRTREAILAFQKREGLTQDGVATAALERRLAQASEWRQRRWQGDLSQRAVSRQRRLKPWKKLCCQPARHRARGLTRNWQRQSLSMNPVYMKFAMQP